MARATGRTVPGGESDVYDEPHVEGRRSTGRGIVEGVGDAGLDPGTVPGQHGPALEKIYRLRTYYYDHPDEIAAVERRRRERERAARKSGAESLDETRPEE
jgi:hypothetical protein